MTQTIIILYYIILLFFLSFSQMEFLQCVRLYAKKPTNSLANIAITKPQTIDWNERLQTTRRLIGDQLSRLKIEEACLRNLTLENEQSKRTLSSANLTQEQDASLSNRKRFCTVPTNNFDVDKINQTELNFD